MAVHLEHEARPTAIARWYDSDEDGYNERRPYQWICTIVKDGDTAIIRGVHHDDADRQRLKPKLKRIIRELLLALRDAGFKWVRFERDNTGTQRERRYELHDRGIERLTRFASEEA